MLSKGMALVTHVLPVTAKKDQAELVVNITAKGSLNRCTYIIKTKHLVFKEIMPYTYIGGKHLKMTVVVKIAPKKQLLYKYKFFDRHNLCHFRG